MQRVQRGMLVVGPGTSTLSVPRTLVRRPPIIFCCARYARANRVSSALAKRAEAVGRSTQYLGEGKTTPSPPRFQDEFEQLTLGERIALAKGSRGNIDNKLGSKANDLQALRRELQGEGGWNGVYIHCLMAIWPSPARRFSRASTIRCSRTSRDILSKTPGWHQRRVPERRRQSSTDKRRQFSRQQFDCGEPRTIPATRLTPTCSPRSSPTALFAGA
jgi:hypothetical protein